MPTALPVFCAPRAIASPVLCAAVRSPRSVALPALPIAAGRSWPTPPRRRPLRPHAGPTRNPTSPPDRARRRRLSGVNIRRVLPAPNASAGCRIERVPMSDFEIVRREDFSDVTYLLEVRHPLMARAARPGQFVIVMLARARRADPAHDRRLRPRARHDHARHPGGRQDHARDAAGVPGRHPALRPGRADGIPTAIGHAKKVVCVGGGLGVAPIFPQARGHKEAGAYVIGVLGFRTRKLVFWEDKFRRVCDELILCTNDGSAGMQRPHHRRRPARRSRAMPTSTRWSPSARR